MRFVCCEKKWFDYCLNPEKQIGKLKFVCFLGSTSDVGKMNVEYLQHAAAKCSAKLKIPNDMEERNVDVC